MSNYYREEENYLQLSKPIGSVDSDRLRSTGRSSEREEERAVTAHTKMQYAKAAGSSLIEAALVIQDSHQPHEYDDYRLELINDGQLALERVVRYEEQLLESGIKNPDDQSDLLRAVLLTKFQDVYNDIVCGELSELTRDSTMNALKDQLRTISRIKRYANGVYAEKLNGLRNEIHVLMDIWRQGNGEIAVPASHRADSGTFLRQETHDISCFTLQTDGSFIPTRNIEVKGESARLFEALNEFARYQSELAIVSQDGRIRYLK